MEWCVVKWYLYYFLYKICSPDRSIYPFLLHMLPCVQLNMFATASLASTHCCIAGRILCTHQMEKNVQCNTPNPRVFFHFAGNQRCLGRSSREFRDSNRLDGRQGQGRKRQKVRQTIFSFFFGAFGSLLFFSLGVLFFFHRNGI